MKVLIVEDEKLAIERLQRLLAELDFAIKVIGSVRSVASAVDYLQQQPAPDLILMDIELSDGQCFEIFEKVQVASFVIFTTSYQEHALRAFQANSLDYLLKPIRKEDLEKSIQKYQFMQQRFIASYKENKLQVIQKELQEASCSSNYREHFLIKQGQRYITIAVTDVVYFFVEGRLTYMVTLNKQKLVVNHSLEEIETMIDPINFYRSNRSFIIHRKAVIGFKKVSNGKLLIELDAPVRKEVIVSKEKASDFKMWIEKRSPV